jgi:DNA-binding beta-propeller fold protein YncE
MRLWFRFLQFSNRLRLFLGGKQGEELSQFDQPQSVAITSDQSTGQQLLLVADCMNGRVCVWSADDRQPIREMGKGILSMPLDVAVSNTAPRTCVVVADRGQHCISVFDLASGRFLNRFGAGLPGPRLDPISVSLSPVDLVCVADKDGHRVHVFELDGTHVRSFGLGQAGTGLGQFTSPRGIAVTDNGDIIVSEENRLQVIDSVTGTHIRFLGSQTPEFSGGRKLLCLNDEVWVADASSTLGTIYVFAISDGRLLNKVGGFLKGPVAVALSPNGDVFVCESGAHRISVLN